jgi:hypothetical protein
MRVEIVGEIASLKDRLPAVSGESFEKASDNRVLANFRAAFSGEVSFFHLQDSIAGFPGQAGEIHGAYVGQFVITFRRLDLNRNRTLYLFLLQALQELLKAGSSDALFATLCVTATATATEEARPPDLSLVLQLDAIGTTPEQAEMRWGSGLEHVQQALLSASRLLAHHLEKTSV